MGNFKKYNIEPTDDNIKESIQCNNYGRVDFVKNFIEGLEMIDTNVFICLDAKWGEGKTFCVRQIEMTLKYLSNKLLQQDVSDFGETFSGSQLNNISIESTYMPIYYNAWLYDCHNDPLISLLYVLVKECGKYVSTTMDTKSVGDKLISLLSSFSLPFIESPGDLEKVKAGLTGKDLLAEVKTAEDIRTTVKEILNDIITESCQKLVIFIDELDRCKPSYAIEMLERIKHYFDDSRIIFVASLNKEQLVHTISRYYGENFDSTGYLNKFFDINIYLPEIPNYMKGNNILQTNNEQYWLKRIVDDLCKYYTLSLRDAIIFKQHIESTQKQYYNDYTADGCMFSMFVPIIQILNIKSFEMKSKFMEGDAELFRELCENVTSIHDLICKFGKDGAINEDNYQIGFEKIFEFYECVFRKNEPYKGELDIQDDFKYACIRVCNGN